MSFRALRIHETPDGRFERQISSLEFDDLPPGELLIRVHRSSLNYKDALSATGHKGITRNYPHTPGIDAAGIVEISRHESFSANEEVLVTGYDLGMNTAGGFAEYIRVPASWAVPLPEGLDFFQAMAIGTAGFTAALALHKIERMGQTPGMGPVVVTGATGGVGSLAVSILARAGYEVIAVTGKENAREYLLHLGAARIEPRSFAEDRSGKALIRSRWAAAIDTVGGNMLETLLKGCRAEGSVVSTGLVGSPELHTTVYPFILNGINLLGVGSAETAAPLRLSIWKKLISDWDIRDKLSVIAREVSLEELDKTYIPAILEGKLMGRIVVRTGKPEAADPARPE